MLYLELLLDEAAKQGIELPKTQFLKFAKEFYEKHPMRTVSPELAVTLADVEGEFSLLPVREKEEEELVPAVAVNVYRSSTQSSGFTAYNAPGGYSE